MVNYKGNYLDGLTRKTVALFLLLVSTTVSQSGATRIEGSSPPIEIDLELGDTKLQFGTPVPLGAVEYLEAEGMLSIEVPLTNLGPGKAYNVRIDARLIDPPRYVTGGSEKYIPIMMPGETVRFVVKVAAGELAAAGQVRLRIDHTEKFDRTAAPIALDIPVTALASPVLEIVDHGIDDDDVKPSIGNDNNRIEIGERIELQAMIQNLGEGKARGVEVVVTLPDDLTLIGQAVSEPGDMPPGSHELVTFLFEVPPSYKGKSELMFIVDLIEKRPRFSVRDTLVFNLDVLGRAAEDLETITWQATDYSPRTIAVAPPRAINIDVDQEENIPKARVSNPNGWAVIIGNRRYRETHNNLPFAIRDAQMMRKYVEESLGFPSEQIEAYSKDDATLGDFRSIFGAPGKSLGGLADDIDATSDLIVYYSGHGSSNATGDASYLIPTDCYAADAENNGYPLDTLLAHLGKLEARSITVIIDACFSGLGPSGPLVPGSSDWERVVYDITKEAVAEKMAVFSAASGAERANSYRDMEHNVYTYYILKGLQGDADLDGDGVITAGELHDFVADRKTGVPFKVRKLWPRRRQTPKFQGDRSLLVRGEVK